VCQQPFQRKAYMKDWSQERGPFCGFECYGRWQREHATGSANPNYQPKTHFHLPCSWCGQTVHRTRNEMRHSKGMVFCDRRCFETFARTRWTGRRSPTGQGYGKSWRRTRREALERDGHRCCRCDTGSDLVVHHRQPFATFQDRLEAHALDNLETLCRSCHLRVHGN
jgi:5-methylcytosine-specific restriction endonuclease McrA